MGDFIWYTAAFIGFAVMGWQVFWLWVRMLRALYWAIWTLIPVIRANSTNATVKNVLTSFWLRYITEFFETHEYKTKETKYYTHSYWPWQQPREWF